MPCRSATRLRWSCAAISPNAKAAGQLEEDVLRQLGDPVALAESYLTAVPLASGSFVARAVAKIIDVLIVGPVVGSAAWLLWRALPRELAPFAILAAIVGGSLLFAVYTVIAEARLSQTLGKHLVGLRVVRESGARISIGQSIVRQLPMFLQIFLIDALFALFTEKSQRAFELLSKTRVVTVASEQGQRSESVARISQS